jgi:alpha-N-acetylglucosaminidase
MMKRILLSVLLFPVIAFSQTGAEASKETLVRLFGSQTAGIFDLQLKETPGMNDNYRINAGNEKVSITASTPVALCRGAYQYLRNTGDAVVSWSGNNVSRERGQVVPYTEQASSPYRYHYYFNIVTHGYTTPYWDWERWQQEIDWMSVHGLDMPLLGTAYEAILSRVFKKLGLTDEEISVFFTGPAHLPWNKMGNITRLNSPLPGSFFDKQIKLNHQILDRLKEMKMHPIVQAFAGFVPDGIKRLYPDIKLRDLDWGGFTKEYNAHILEPGSPLFVKIGGMFIEEWEKEFGKSEFYLADSFNEMAVPLSKDSTKALEELAMYGQSVYESIHKAAPDATWVMMGWTFPFQRDWKTGKLFWTPQRLSALFSKVPNDKLLILDMANEYNRVFWKIPESWKMFDGFFGKQWIYSFIPNMGGKSSLNGILDIYATIPIEALNYPGKKNLVGFGFAPEGIENNEIIYELLSDMGWRDKEIDLDKWIGEYCKDRYGAFPENMKKAYDIFRKTCFGTFTDHPRFKYQLGPRPREKASVDTSRQFVEGVKLFLSCKDQIHDSKLFQNDVIEFSTQYLGLQTDRLLTRFEKTGKTNYALLNEAIGLMNSIDRLLASHTTFQLKRWVDLARKYGSTEQEKNYYEANAKEILTIWGDNGEITDYAARTWSGLVRDYYAQRWKKFYDAKKNKRDFNLLKWEQQWVKTPWVPKTVPYERPVEEAAILVKKYSK